jgi:hypothetical protein
MKRSNNDVYRFYFSREVEFSGIPSGCFYQFDSVPGVSASLQPPATFCDRFAIKIIDPHVTISPTNIVTRVERRSANDARVNGIFYVGFEVRAELKPSSDAFFAQIVRFQ